MDIIKNKVVTISRNHLMLHERLHNQPHRHRLAPTFCAFTPRCYSPTEELLP